MFSQFSWLMLLFYLLYFKKVIMTMFEKFKPNRAGKSASNELLYNIKLNSKLILKIYYNMNHKYSVLCIDKFPKGSITSIEVTMFVVVSSQGGLPFV